MQTTTLGPFTVSRLCLGAMLMGGATPADEAHTMLDRFLEAGGTFIDTADTYEDGASERTLAPWLARHRDQVVIATKVRFGVSDPGGEGLAPDRIRAACEASLRRLGVDTIDLYQVHAPDPAVPLEDTLAALDGLVQAGKVRALGASNFPAWLLAWGPLGAGFLTGRYRRDRMPADGRVSTAAGDLEEAADRRATERNFRVVDAATEIAERHGRPIPQVALAWLLGVPGVTAPVIGPRTLAQLDDLLGATDLDLDDAERARLAEPAPPPDISPHRMLREQLGLPDVPTLRRPTRPSPA